MSGYANDRKWADQFIPEIKRIVGPHLLIPAPFEVDAKQNADLITLKARDLMIACRVRRRCSWNGTDQVAAYGWQFTIRSRRDSGAVTELEKLTNGYGDWMFYGFASVDDDYLQGFARWSLIDLIAWRAHMIRNGDRIKQGETPNGDGTYFKWYDLRSFPPEPRILIASSEELPPMPEPKKAKASVPVRSSALPLFDPILEAIDR